MRKVILAIIPASLIILLSVAFRVYQHYAPFDATAITAAKNQTHNWQTYRHEHLSASLRYPENYFLCSKDERRGISLRQDTSKAENCKTSGKRVRVDFYELEHVRTFGLSGDTIKANPSISLDDIAEQFKIDPTVTTQAVHECNSDTLDGIEFMICTQRAPGEAPEFTGGRLDINALRIHETGDGKRVLVVARNNGGGTPYVGDRDLHQKTIQIFHTITFDK